MIRNVSIDGLEEYTGMNYFSPWNIHSHFSCAASLACASDVRRPGWICYWGVSSRCRFFCFHTWIRSGPNCIVSRRGCAFPQPSPISTFYGFHLPPNLLVNPSNNALPVWLVILQSAGKYAICFFRAPCWLVVLANVKGNPKCTGGIILPCLAYRPEATCNPCSTTSQWVTLLTPRTLYCWKFDQTTLLWRGPLSLGVNRECGHNGHWGSFHILHLYPMRPKRKALSCKRCQIRLRLIIPICPNLWEEGCSLNSPFL